MTAVNGIAFWECTQVVEETSPENWEAVHSGASVRSAPFPPCLSSLVDRHCGSRCYSFVIILIDHVD